MGIAATLSSQWTEKVTNYCGDPMQALLSDECREYCLCRIDAGLPDIIKDRPGTLLKLPGKHSRHEHFFDYGDL